ncbi:hypothetical protein S7711_11636 [Stachybotrys chartarum IBT 7711]|nr:hypothetical protein S7711_11636 [Stachybotrys chartarum IBT 7711]
MNAPGP